jgi:hypothetical protein
LPPVIKKVPVKAEFLTSRTAMIGKCLKRNTSIALFAIVTDWLNILMEIHINYIVQCADIMSKSQEKLNKNVISFIRDRIERKRLRY